MEGPLRELGGKSFGIVVQADHFRQGESRPPCGWPCFSTAGNMGDIEKSIHPANPTARVATRRGATQWAKPALRERPVLWIFLHGQGLGLHRGGRGSRGRVLRSLLSSLLLHPFIEAQRVSLQDGLRPSEDATQTNRAGNLMVSGPVL